MKCFYIHEDMEQNLGVLVGCDENQEWMLPWWFSHFRQANPNLSVAFADFGMSKSAKIWCEERGSRLEIPSLPLYENKGDPGVLFMGERWCEWRLTPPRFTTYPIWFAKASAMLLSPFYRTLWLDLDCQVLSDLSTLFSLPLPKSKLRMRKACKIFVKSYPSQHIFEIPTYNSGVILYEKDSPLLKMWSQANEEGIHHFSSDDYIISLFIACLKDEKISLPLKYNWNITSWGDNREALIYHWQKDVGKNRIYFQSIVDASNVVS